MANNYLVMFVMKTRKNKILFHKIKKKISISFPYLVRIYRFFFKKKLQSFSGWGMTIFDRSPPWIKNSSNNEAQNFIKTHEQIKEMVNKKKFILTQFSKLDNDYSGTKALDEFRWRHYILSFCINYVCKYTKQKNYNFVELGVLDGMTAFFACSMATLNKKKFRIYLYDSWGPMKSDHLLDSELKSIGAYHYLDVNIVMDNLKKFKKNLVINKGYLPDSLKTAQNPKTVTWLHIDLNSTKPTIDSLKKIFNRIVKNGIILFDDYGFDEHFVTRIAIDKFLKNKNGLFFHAPTGQGIFIKL